MLPPPPPPERRFYQMLTTSAQQAVQARSGLLYQTLIETLLKLNPDCFQDKSDVAKVLDRYVWPPNRAEDICFDFPHIPKFPTHLKVSGNMAEVLISDPQEVVTVFLTRMALKQSFSKSFGGSEGLNDLRQKFMADGCTYDDFDKMMRAELMKAERKLRKPWWKLW